MLYAAARLNQEQLLSPTDHSFGSLRSTLVHIYEAAYGWRMLCQHNTRTEDIDPLLFFTLDVLEQPWHAEELAMRAYLASLVRYTTGSGQKRQRLLWHCLFHVVNHGTQHRSVAAAI